MAKFNEKNWLAQEDAYTLARALEIYADGGRLKAAQASAKKQYDEVVKQASGLKKIMDAGKVTSRTKKK